MGVFATDFYDSSGYVEAHVTLSSASTLVAKGVRVAPAQATILAKGEIPDPKTGLRSSLTEDLYGTAAASANPTARYAADADPQGSAALLLGVTGIVRKTFASPVARATVTLENAARTTFIGAGNITSVVGNRSIELTPVELRMLEPFPTPALEDFRRRALTACVTSTSPTAGVRTVSVLALSTDQRGVFVNLLGTSSPLLRAAPLERRRLLDADRDLRMLDPVRAQALAELRGLGAPPAYLDVFVPRLANTNYNVRVVATCGVVLFAALLLQDTTDAA